MLYNLNNFEKKKDDAVTSVVGEMLILALVIILIALFAVSAFNLIPGDRDTAAEIKQSDYVPGAGEISFWHKGGDWISAEELKVSVYNDESDTIYLERLSLKDWQGNDKDVFDLGGCYTVKIPAGINGHYQIRLSTQSSVIYAGEVNLDE